MKLPDSAHTSQPWRIHELTPDFRLEDVWALPTPGGPDDLARLVRLRAEKDEGGREFPAVFRALFAVRWKLGEVFGWDRADSSSERVRSLRERLPADLLEGPRGPDLRSVPGRTEVDGPPIFASVYQTHDEWVTEFTNKTVHSLMHVGWVPHGSGRGYRAQMAVLVKPNGLFGRAYMAAIKPFRNWIVYPSLMRAIEHDWQTSGRLDVTLPPGQHRTEGFPRFGKHLHRPAPAVPSEPAIEIGGAVSESFAVPLATLATLPRRELTADLHCVAGWSATNQHWEGVAFETFYRRIVEPSAQPGTSVTHVAFCGLDAYRSVALLEDALADDVLIAERLNGQPLDGDHGAPARLVSPSQYGFVSTKHLCRIELHTAEPTDANASLADRLLAEHPRARVWEEERHRLLPAWSVRPIYRLLVPPIAFLSARGSRRSWGVSASKQEPGRRAEAAANRERRDAVDERPPE